MRVVIVGGGVMGMMLARELGMQGVQVILTERRACGREASWAGGGIVSPLYPWRYRPAVTALSRWSQYFYPNLVQTLEAETGIDAEISHHGLLMVSVHDREAALSWARAESYRMDEVPASGLKQIEPALADTFTEALWMPQVASVRNPRLCRALRASLDHLQTVTVLDMNGVARLEISGDRVQGVWTEDGTLIEADRVVLCAGAWTSGLLAPLGVTLPVVPVKGQMVAFQAEPGQVRTIVLADGKYVIPRRDGLVVAGSTLEHAGFDKSTTDDALDQLTASALRMIPALQGCPVVARWAGLRPGSPDGIPFIGPVPGVDGLYVNAGQYRNGLVTAPASVALMASLLLGAKAPVDPSPYRLEGRLAPAELEEA